MLTQCGTCSLLQYGFVVGGDNVTKCNGRESSNVIFSFPEHFEGKRQSGEMYQKDCLPLLSTFCKFQRLKVKGSRVMHVCLHSASTQSNMNVADVTDVLAVQRYNSFVAATCNSVCLLKCTHGNSLQVWHCLNTYNSGLR